MRGRKTSLKRNVWVESKTKSMNYYEYECEFTCCSGFVVVVFCIWLIVFVLKFLMYRSSSNWERTHCVEKGRGSRSIHRFLEILTFIWWISMWLDSVTSKNELLICVRAMNNFLFIDFIGSCIDSNWTIQLNFTVFPVLMGTLAISSSWALMWK